MTYASMLLLILATGSATIITLLWKILQVLADLATVLGTTHVS